MVYFKRRGSTNRYVANQLLWHIVENMPVQPKMRDKRKDRREKIERYSIM